MISALRNTRCCGALYTTRRAGTLDLLFRLRQPGVSKAEPDVFVRSSEERRPTAAYLAVPGGSRPVDIGPCGSQGVASADGAICRFRHQLFQQAIKKAAENPARHHGRGRPMHKLPGVPGAPSITDWLQELSFNPRKLVTVWTARLGAPPWSGCCDQQIDQVPDGNGAATAPAADLRPEIEISLAHHTGRVIRPAERLAGQMRHHLDTPGQASALNTLTTSSRTYRPSGRSIRNISSGLSPDKCLSPIIRVIRHKRVCACERL